MRLIPTFEFRPRWRKCGRCGDPFEVTGEWKMLTVLPTPTIARSIVEARVLLFVRCLGCGRRTTIESVELVEITDAPARIDGIVFHAARPERLYRQEVSS